MKKGEKNLVPVLIISNLALLFFLGLAYSKNFKKEGDDIFVKTYKMRDFSKINFSNLEMVCEPVNFWQNTQKEAFAKGLPWKQSRDTVKVKRGNLFIGQFFMVSDGDIIHSQEIRAEYSVNAEISLISNADMATIAVPRHTVHMGSLKEKLVRLPAKILFPTPDGDKKIFEGAFEYWVVK